MKVPVLALTVTDLRSSAWSIPVLLETSDRVLSEVPSSTRVGMILSKLLIGEDALGSSDLFSTASFALAVEVYCAGVSRPKPRPTRAPSTTCMTTRTAFLRSATMRVSGSMGSVSVIAGATE